MRASLQNNVFGYNIKESQKHYLGKRRLYELFKSNGFEVHSEVPSQERLDNGDIKNYVFDILVVGKFVGSKRPIYTILEVDGRKGHRTGITDNKARVRDEHFLNKYNIPTIRFAFEDLHGVNKIDDDLIMKEVEYWIKQDIDKIAEQDKKLFSKKARCCKCGHFSNVHTFSGCMSCSCEFGFIHELQ